MGIVTYVGPNSPADITLPGGQIQRVVSGVQYTLADAVCSVLLLEAPGWWLPGDQHTRSLIPTNLAPIITVTAAQTLAFANTTVFIDTTAGAFTTTLAPTPPSGLSVLLRAITTGTNIALVNTSDATQIDGASTLQLGTAASGAPYQAAQLTFDGTMWRIT